MSLSDRSFSPEDVASVPGPLLVTGASGFIGTRLVERLRTEGRDVRAMVRQASRAELDAGAVVADLDDPASLQRACDGVTAIVHCAGHAHAFGESPAVAKLRHRQVNYEGTCRLLDAAVGAGVGRIVFMSSVKAMGEPGLQCVDESWTVPPATPYGIAKRDAERALLSAGREHGLCVTNLRLAMVYGPGSRGNLERMASAIRAGWFPPLPETGARRSLIHVDDVVDAVCAVLSDPRACGRTFIVAHPEPVSPATLYEILCHASGRRPARVRVPETLLRGLATAADGLSRVTGRRLPFGREVAARLLDSECYLPGALERELGWVARTSLESALCQQFGQSSNAFAAPRP